MTMRSLLSFGAFVVALLLIARLATAAEPTWPDRAVTVEAQEQPLGDFLREFFQAAGIRALPNDTLQGRVSGRFSDRPEKIFNDLVKAYDLLPYYDGTVMHVASSRDMQSKSIRAQAADLDKIANVLKASHLSDRYQTIQVSRDTGLIKLRGAPEFIRDMEELAASQRRPEPRATNAPAGPPPGSIVFRSFQLKYASAADQTFYPNGQEVKVPGVVSLLRSMMGQSGPLIPASASGPRPGNRNVPSIRGQGLRRNQSAGGGDGDGEKPGHSQAPPPSDGGGGPARIEADPNLNAVIVRDYAESMDTYEELINQLDKEPQLVEIQVTIVDIDKNRLNDLGVDWSYNSGSTSASAGGGDPGQQNGGLLLNTVLGDAGHFLARVNALAKNGDAQVISRPQVLTLSNLEAILATDQSFFVRVAGREDVDLFDVSVGTSLRVVPIVAGRSDDPQIRLRVAIEDGSISDKTVDDIPIVDRATLNTQAVIYDGQSLLLGGLVRDESTKNTSKVPVLGDVPGVGRLFKRTTSTKATQERLFLISPRIIATNRVQPASTPARPPAGPAPSNGRPAVTAEAPPRPVSPPPVAQRPQGYLDGF